MDDQRVTLDPNVEIPEDAPRAQHHSEEDAKAAREAQLDHKDAVEAAAKGEEVGARAPGDHAEVKKTAKKSD